jgi:hypothetical protein
MAQRLTRWTPDPLAGETVTFDMPGGVWCWIYSTWFTMEVSFDGGDFVDAQQHMCFVPCFDRIAIRNPYDFDMANGFTRIVMGDGEPPRSVDAQFYTPG